MFKVKEIRTGLEEVENNEKCSIIKITNELYDNAFLIDKMIQYGIFGKLVFE